MKKTKFKIEITEILKKIVQIKADNVDIAFETVTQKYKSEEIVFAWNNFIDNEIKIVDYNQ